MTKRATSLLFTILFLLIGTASAWGAPSCNTTFSKTKFKKNTNISDTFYSLEDVSFEEGIATMMGSPLTYTSNANPKRGEYTVTNNKVSIGCTKTASQFTISIPNLITTPGRNQYTISIQASVRLRARENDAEEKHRTKFKLAVGNTNKYFENSGSDYQATGPCNMSLDFTASTETASAVISTDYSGTCYILDITEITIKGCYTSQIICSTGSVVYAGLETTYTALGLTGNIEWRFNGQPIPGAGNGNSIVFSTTENGKLTATSGGTTLEFAIAPVIHCAASAKNVKSVEVNFTMFDENKCDLPNTVEGFRYGFTAQQTKYQPNTTFGSGSGPLGSGSNEQYVIAQSTEGMYPGWSNNGTSPILGNTGGANDGFMIINAGQAVYQPGSDAGTIFQCNINQDICPETTYEFSADICFLDYYYGTQTDTPANVRFEVWGLNGNTRSPQPLTWFETGTITAPGVWTPYRRSLNTGSYSAVQIVMYNNQRCTYSGDVRGNDIGVDNIVFSRCVPRIMVHFDDPMNITNSAQLPTQYCNRGDQLIPLYVGHHDYSITELMKPTAYFIVEESLDGGSTWTTIKTDLAGSVNMQPTLFGTNGVEIVNAYVRNNQGATKYRAIVAPSSTDIIAIQANNNVSLPGCNVFYITESQYQANLTFACTNNSIPPTLQNFNQCATGTTLDLWEQLTAITINDGTTTGNVIDLSDKTVTEKQTIVNAQGEIKWYDANDQEISSTITLPASGATPVTYKATFTQSGSYQPSSPATVTVQVPETITFDLTPTEIKGCASNFTEASTRTITISNLSPATLTGATYDWTDTNTNATNQDGTTSYVVPATGSGTVSLKITATGVCDSNENDQVEYSLNEQTTITDIMASPSVVCVTNPTSTLSANVNIQGTTYNWYKGTDLTTPVSTGTVGTDGKATYTDSNVSATQGTVTYTLVVGDPQNCGAQATINVTVATEITYTMTAKQGTTTIANGGSICQGTDVTIESGVTDFDSNVQTLKWYSDAAMTQELTAHENQTSATFTNVQETLKAYIAVTGGTCDGSGSITINVDTKPVVIIKNTRSTICHGDTNTVHIDYSDASVVIPAASTFKWEAWYNGDTNNSSAIGDAYQGEFVQTSQHAFKEHTFTNAGKYTFALTVDNGTCSTTSEKIDFWVAGDPNFTISASKDRTCGEEVTLNIVLQTNQPNNYNAYWTLNESDEALAGKEVSSDLKTITNKVSPQATTTYTAHVEATCTAKQDKTITVDKAATLTLEEEFTVCKDQEVTLALSIQGDYNNLTWTPANGLSNIKDIQPVVTASDIATQQQQYTVQVESGECVISDTTTVKIYDLPVITQLATTDKARQIKVDVNGMDPTFTIDQTETVYDVPAIVSDLPIGWRKIYVTDANQCKTDSTIYIEPIPIKPMPYFTPNDEGAEESELWTVKDLDQYHSYIIEIFDRYGRRLLEYRTGSFSTDNKNGNEPFGWDGMYNGHQMPSDDYWYLITVEEIRKQYTGHFILKR